MDDTENHLHNRSKMSYYQNPAYIQHKIGLLFNLIISTFDLFLYKSLVFEMAVVSITAVFVDLKQNILPHVLHSGVK